ncbi:hypothetical protein [Ectothiorhodospira lacustris]|uniref:hypothetical protein n=1 Tax=Ectothiorhodospira lacustris TaxID=2899127 RepID=UPI001EE7D530|nr:hypothetical protein [Ectothiorhodospira lacustris]MCG5509361.1 hypothetical protein [Ectothiorhodospira lacustris]MCG5521415.1 hypothetical protein [Ectothiorhodospira lacustris]
MSEEPTSADNPQPYTGPERRRGERRKQPDRREMIRFELEKDPRRSGRDRRKDRRDLWERRDF